ncbi:putative phenylalanyl-tRNA synthetase beta chain [Dioszegia hungarica]|uniref:Phenylalanine--tRNA ligase beta subunit n=1 Tax=Dioszegia hungarica TaxID=4972 RepID=A0AA38LU79_9TREE|nr:putative phenylalanyl-tRNA synthetase beta chain [Dioszegia hungarica]KAI9634529.1 putative phenylalanyl-tRNA synthetase beta chain [Dioszegia hungarica]
MPTITVDKAELYKRLEREYSTEEFDELCFTFGVELDEDTTKDVLAARAKNLPTPPPQLKIEIPANRYDLLCVEGIAKALRVFLGLEKTTHYTLSSPAKMEELYVEASTSPLRPFAAAAILRLAQPMSQAAYDSFIDLQDKLHMNLCRQRRLVSMGTHDLDTIEGPFRYVCEDPKTIKFAPLNKDQEYTGEELMTLYDQDRNLSRFLNIIRDAPAYPVIYDKNNRVCSLPPIINSQHSKIVAGRTENILLEITATDKTKLDIVVNMLSTMFSEYCKVPFEIEPVRIHMPDGSSHISPPIAPRRTTASSAYINAATGLSLSREKMSEMLNKMSLASQPSADADVLDVEVPCTRPDILHECDIMEDLAIAYGYNDLPKSLPTTNTVAKPFPVNRLADILRKECAQAGWLEALPLILCSHDENFAWLNRPDPGNYAVALANPKSLEYQVVRTSLLPGILKTARENKSLALPMKIFEVSDVAIQDPSVERQVTNYRRMVALYMDKKAGFEMVHGLLDRMMQILGVPFLQSEKNEADYGYYIAGAEDPTYLPGRGARVYLRPKPSIPAADLAKPTPSAPATSNPLHTIAETLKAALPGSATKSRDIVLGSLGILHPSVLGKFELSRPCSVLEVDIEPLL